MGINHAYGYSIWDADMGRQFVYIRYNISEINA